MTLSCLKRLGAIALAVSVLSSGVALAATSGTSTAVDQILQQGMAGGSGGTFGYYLKQVGGSVLLARNDGFVYDPASAVKTLYLAYAIRQGESLSSPVMAYLYPNSRNANGNPASSSLCPDQGDEVSGNLVNPTPTLRDVLYGMMVASDNRYTRAVELRYGRGNLQAYASSLGMGNTRLVQILGCGADGGVQNSWTLDDAGRLYEAIDNGSAVPTTARDTLYGLMLTNQGNIYMSLINSEASSLGIADAASEFASGMLVRYKGGSYDICYGSCGSQDVVTRDEAGVLTVPFQDPGGVTPREYVWGTFIANVQMSCPNFPCAPANQVGSAVESSLAEVFRPAIHAALQTWASLTTLAADQGTTGPRGLKVSAQLFTRYGGRNPSGETIEFSANGRVICAAKTNSVGTASCTGPSPKGKLTDYTAKFAGGDGLFASSATAPIVNKTIKLTVSVKINGKGVITSSPPGINCGKTCKHTFVVGPAGKVVLKAKLPAGSKISWAGACTGSSLNCILRPTKATARILAVVK